MLNLDDNQRGWVLACVSGIACVLGALIIGADQIVHAIPRWRHFSIQKSTTFQAAALSLSFGVMFFSSLYSMLPESREYFLRAGLSGGGAGYAVIGSFLAGVVGLQIVSDLLHRCLPSSIVHCEEHEAQLPTTPAHSRARSLRNVHSDDSENTLEDEESPLLTDDSRSSGSLRRPSGLLALANTCKSGGKCWGYSDHVCHGAQSCESDNLKRSLNSKLAFPRTTAQGLFSSEGTPPHKDHTHDHDHDHHSHDHSDHHSLETTDGHHHIPENSFMSIGVQTSIAIALHKFPEGFIMYATNQANPKLGFTVFLALFIHNIAEGFSMALPLYLALNSRRKAVLCASILGGLTQPLGAAIAWASMRGHRFELNYGAYGVLFAITAGIMCAVGLQLFTQAIKMHHDPRLSFVFSFIGMGILGASSALTE